GEEALLLLEGEDAVLERRRAIGERANERRLRVHPAERGVEVFLLRDLEVLSHDAGLLVRRADEQGEAERDLLHVEERRLMALHSSAALLVDARAIVKEKAEAGRDRG